MNFRKAEISDVEDIFEIFRKAIISMDSKGIHQWDEIYPDKTDISEDIENNTLSVLEIDDKIAGAIVLNEFQDKEYADINWRYKNDKVAVIHRLCVNPCFQNQGIAKKLIAYIENYAVNKGYTSIRLDCYTKNPYAVRLYESCNYEHAGEVTFRKGQFFVFEKKLI